MRKHTKTIVAILLVTIMAFGLVACSADPPTPTPAPASDNNATAPAATPEPAPDTPANTSPITVVWYPNESANDFEPAREEYGRLITEATGREVIHRITTDYVIAVEALASGAADIGARWGATGMIEAQQRNPEVMPLIVNSGASGTLDDAVYFGWLVVNLGEEDPFRSGDSFSIENIQGKTMSFVSNSSTSGFVVPAGGIIDFFSQTAEWSEIDEDDLLGLSRNPFFEEVLFGGSHQGSLFNLIDGRADIAAICDTCVDSYVELVSGDRNTVGAVYRIQQNAAAPFENSGGHEFILIGIAPVLNGPDVFNPQNLSAEEIEAIRAILTSDEAAANPLFFGEEGVTSLIPRSGDMRFVVADNSWWDPLRS